MPSAGVNQLCDVLLRVVLTVRGFARGDLSASSSDENAAEDRLLFFISFLWLLEHVTLHI